MNLIILWFTVFNDLQFMTVKKLLSHNNMRLTVFWHSFVIKFL
nr:MAG TPA: hypothetical protein [Bacteriophage sp.]